MKIKGKWDKTKLVSHFGRPFREERKEEKKKKKKKRKGMETIFMWITMGLYGFLDICMDISSLHF